MRHIFISAGHSDTEPGAVANEVQENTVAEGFRDLVAFYLAREGVKFSMDGEKGENLPLSKAVKLIPKDSVAVEFHLNADPTSATGVETLSSPKDYALGNKLCQAVSARLGIRNRGAKPENSGQHKTLAFVQAGGLILELFFITNKGDRQAYEEVKWLLAKEVANVLIEEAGK